LGYFGLFFSKNWAKFYSFFRSHWNPGGAFSPPVEVVTEPANVGLGFKVAP
jgi:hypothetical protein